jgi:hypothetical protein
MSEELTDEYLAHFGRLGMKWGVVTEEKQTKRDAKAAEYTAKAKGYQKEIDKLSKQRSGRAKQRINELNTLKTTALADAEAKRQGKMTQKQKHVAVGVGIAAGVLAAYGTYSMAQSGQLHSVAERGKAFMAGKDATSWKRNANLAQSGLSAEEISSKVVGPINKGYGSFGTKMNCRRCTYAYEMRRRGFDVSATKTSNARGQDLSGLHNVLTPETHLVHPGRGGMVTRVLTEMGTRKGGKEGSFTSTLTKLQTGGKQLVPNSDILGEIGRLHPDGARGELTMAWMGGGSHSVAWEKIKGKVVIFDTQTRKVYKSNEALSDGLPAIGRAAITRLDNIPLNDNFLIRWLKNDV